MVKKLWIVVLAGLLGLWVTAACDDGGDGDADGDADSDSDTDSDTDSDGDGDGAWPCAQADTENPSMRLTALQITAPEALTSLMLQAILDDSINGFRFIWLVQLDIAGLTMTTGSGRGSDAPSPDSAEFCSVTWNADYPPESGAITFADNTVNSAGTIESLDIPVYSETSPDDPLLILPISLVEISNVRFNADRTLVGTPNAPSGSNMFAQSWETDGELTGWISFDDAMAVPIEELGNTLCGLLCGADCAEVAAGTTTCAEGREPETIPGTDTEGYQLRANIGAGAVTIAE